LPTHQAARPFRAPLASGLSAEQAALWVRGEERPFVLAGDWLGGAVIIGSEPVTTADARDDPFALLDTAAPTRSGEVRVGGGWVGWLGYGLGARIEQLPPSPPAPAPRPPFSLAFYDHVIVLDGGRWWFEALGVPGREAVVRRRLAVWEKRMQSEPPPAREARLEPFTAVGDGPAGHIAAVADCRRRIAEGELFQANLCLRLEARFSGDLVDLFARALPRARPRFGALVDGALSLSPERFLRRCDRNVETEPIKGTRPRSGTVQQREAARAELLDSTKDSAEHVMIVDLMRNDLGRVCEYGTVSANPPRIEAHSGVWHLVSTVTGRLRDGAGDGALLRATFPPGSVTGAPKVQAMKVIAALEATRRELYTGAIGIASPVAGLDLSVAIRTFEIYGDRIWFGAGGGIVADSDPEAELAEALAKAAGPVTAIGGQVLTGARPARGRPSKVQRALAHGDRPDPSAGVFETLLATDGRAEHVDEHLVRLSRSLAQLYDTRLCPRTSERIRAAAAGHNGRWRVRVLADIDGATTVSASPAGPSPVAPRVLMPFALPGGLGAHKWRDRRLLDALGALAPDTTVLLVDSDDLVLEAAYANLWIVEGEDLVTPPADGRILPGVTRAGLLAAPPGAAREEPIELDRLRRADAVFLTSSIAGRHPARLAAPAPA
jgi:anthranilate/para-aminobenzoate synthase component I/branched-subunit amino acid aminotransferase/4-amino-4-deoxychorismate lyase